MNWVTVLIIAATLAPLAFPGERRVFLALLRWQWCDHQASGSVGLAGQPAHLVGQPMCPYWSDGRHRCMYLRHDTPGDDGRHKCMCGAVYRPLYRGVDRLYSAPRMRP